MIERRESPVSSIGEAGLSSMEGMLVQLCRRTGAIVEDVDLEPLAEEECRQQFRELASTHRVLGLVLLALRDLGAAGCLPPEVVEELLQPSEKEARVRGAGSADRRRSFEELRARADWQDRELERLLGLLRAQKLEPVVLKGPALRRTVYDDPVERRYSDFDLLFPIGDVDRALEVVGAAGYAFPFSREQERGYRELHFHLLLRHPDRFRVEIHWGLSRPRDPFRLDPEAFLRRSVPTEAADGTLMRVPCPEHLLLHMAHENLRDSFSRLSRIVDVDRILTSAPGLDWDDIVSQARRGGLQSLLSLSLETSSRLLGTSTPATVMKEIRPSAVAQVHLTLMCPASSLMRQSLQGIGPTLFLLLWLSVGLRNRLRLLVRILSGRRSAEDWIFRESDDGPPSAHERFVAGFKSGLRLVAYHLSVYWNGRGVSRS